MQEANILGELTLVQYPSNHCFVAGLRILLIGKDDQWKNKLVDAANSFWTDTPITFYYIPDDERDINDTDQLSWLYQNYLHCDYVICHMMDDDLDSVISSTFVRDSSTFILYDEKLNENLKSFYKMLNPNLASDAKDVIVRLRDKWKTVNKIK